MGAKGRAREGRRWEKERGRWWLCNDEDHGVQPGWYQRGPRCAARAVLTRTASVQSEPDVRLLGGAYPDYNDRVGGASYCRGLYGCRCHRSRPARWCAPGNVQRADTEHVAQDTCPISPTTSPPSSS
eukprot:3828318-Rhodomonas_salina.1